MGKKGDCSTLVVTAVKGNLGPSFSVGGILIGGTAGVSGVALSSCGV